MKMGNYRCPVGGVDHWSGIFAQDRGADKISRNGTESSNRACSNSESSNPGTYTLPAEYTEQAEKDVALQLSRAGIRLAFVLERAFTASQ